MMDDVKRSELPGLTVQQGPILGYEAQLQGTLAIDASTNCLVVRSADYLIDVAWPATAIVTRAGLTVTCQARGQSSASPR
jgi:hypothetical protein